jgi:hypothetical protein
MIGKTLVSSIKNIKVSVKIGYDIRYLEFDTFTNELDN